MVFSLHVYTLDSWVQQERGQKLFVKESVAALEKSNELVIRVNIQATQRVCKVLIWETKGHYFVGSLCTKVFSPF